MVRDDASTVTLATLADLFGLERADASRLVELTDVARSGSPGAPAAAAERAALLRAVVAARRAAPGDDVASVLATHAHHDDEDAAEALGLAFRTGYDAQAALVRDELEMAATPWLRRPRSLPVRFVAGPA